jgi:hypothetical protein
MLERLLRIVAAEGAATVSGMAQRLDVSPALAETMLADLVRQGYLKPLAVGCGGRCARCPLHTACLFEGPRRLWVLSGKSEALLAECAE